jgi:hypothetical protein
VVQRAEIVVEPARPPLDRRPEVALDPERDIDVGPAITAVGRVRADVGRTHHLVVHACELHELLAHTVTVLHGKHRGSRYPSCANSSVVSLIAPAAMFSSR